MLFQNQCSISDSYNFSQIMVRKWKEISGDKNIQPLNRLDDSQGKKELERQFENDGSGSSHRREATHTYHKGLTHAVWLAHGCGTGTLHRVSSPGCPAWPWARAQRSVQIDSFHDWSHSDRHEITVDTQLSKWWHTTLQKAHLCQSWQWGNIKYLSGK